jgi:hypothetical protein
VMIPAACRMVRLPVFCFCSYGPDAQRNGLWTREFDPFCHKLAFIDRKDTPV